MTHTDPILDGEGYSGGGSSPTGGVQPLPILHTKLYKPRPLPQPVERARLFDRVDEGSAARLTLVSAPPGFGKTTLVSEWLHRMGRRAAWISLDEGDNDPLRFLVYLTAALRSVDQRIGDSTLALLRSQPAAPAESVLTSLINDTLLLDDLVLVLDDYHVISSPQVHEALTYLLEHLPAQLHLIITSRVDPPLPLSRLRSRRQLTEIRSTDLRFTADEAADFLNDVVGLELAAEAIEALESRTEGWIAGLQLAALSMQNRSDLSGFIQAFTGSHRHVVDYLADEVLQRQSEKVQRFLVETSVLDRLYGPLCDALTMGDDGGEMLRTLEEGNLFIIPLDEERCWYRYHHLFADFLRNRLAGLDPSRPAMLHRRASAWHEGAGLMTEAIAHAVAAGDMAEAARLVLENAQDMLVRSEMVTLRTWLGHLPREVVMESPYLSLVTCWVLMLTGAMDEVPNILRNAEERIPFAKETERQMLAGHAAAVNGYLTRIRGELHRSIVLSEEALALLPDGEMIVRGTTTLNMGYSYLGLAETDAALRAFADSVAQNTRAGNIFASLAGLRCLARISVVRGRLHAAGEYYAQGERLVEEQIRRDKRPLIPAGMLYVGLGELAYEWNRGDEAYRHLIAGNKLSELSGDIFVIRDGHIALARLHHSRGEHDKALDTIGKAESLMKRYNSPDWIRSPLATYRARLLVSLEMLAEPKEWMDEQRRRLDEGKQLRHRGGTTDGWLDLEEVERRTIARVLIGLGRYDEAAVVLDELIEAADAAGRDGSLIILLNLRALTFHAAGECGRAKERLIRALRLAEPEGYVRTFLDEGKRMEILLRETAKDLAADGGTADPVTARYVARLLDAFAHEPGAAPAVAAEIVERGVRPAADLPGRSESDPDALSDREIEVLRLVADGLSNKEIAERLFVAAGTVKRHVHNIYAKLDATSRTQAVARAREKGVF